MEGDVRLAGAVGLRQRVGHADGIQPDIAPGQDGDSRVPVLIKVAASGRHFLNQVARTPLIVRPSRFHHPQTSLAARADQRSRSISIKPRS